MAEANVSSEPGPSKQDNSEEGGDDNTNKEATGPNFECNICLDTAKDAVVSVCGHLFCWPCLHQWLELRAHNKTCPVCKAAISREKVIPLYGRGADATKDPRNKAPPRPQGQRTEPEPQNSFMNGFGFGGGGDGGFQFHLGVGAFPFGFFALMNGRPGQVQMPPGMDRWAPEMLKSLLVLVIFYFYWCLIFG